MDYLVICLTAVIASGLTLFSGFGLNTVLMPVMAIFFPPEIAVAMTALVHCANNVFKTLMLRKHVDTNVVLRFGIPAVIAAVAGAWLLTNFPTMQPLGTWHLGEHEYKVRTLNLVIAAMMFIFALEPAMPLEKLKISRRHLPVGGVLSGFMGGLSGHQGALRSAFLLKCGLDKETYVGSGAVITLMVDVTRIIMYAWGILILGKANLMEGKTGLVLAATLAAFLGAFIGKRLLKKVTITTIQWIVSIMMILIAIALGSGLIGK